MRLDLFWRLFREGKLREARALCARSLDALAEGDDEWRVRWGCCWAKCERTAGNLWGALCCHAAMKDALGRVSPASKAKALIGLGLTFKLLADEGEGADLRERALDCNREALPHAGDDPELLGVIENNTASVLIAQERAGEAFEFLAEARRRVEESGEQWRLTEVEDTLARAHLACGDTDGALKAAFRAVASARADGEGPALGRALDTLDAVTRAMKEGLGA